MAALKDPSRYIYFFLYQYVYGALRGNSHCRVEYQESENPQLHSGRNLRDTLL